MPKGENAYVMYDPRTGQVLGSHRSVDEEGRAVSEPLKRVRSHLRQALELAPTQSVEVLQAELPPGRFAVEFYVDPKSKRLVEKHDLLLQPEKEKLEGDGEDRTAIGVSVVDARGRPVRAFDGEVVVITSRGRLSERGGRLALRGGTGTIVLQSAAETVHSVQVNAYDPGGRCNLGTAELEFV
jgi:hypothetical protein